MALVYTNARLYHLSEADTSTELCETDAESSSVKSTSLYQVIRAFKSVKCQFNVDVKVLLLYRSVIHQFTNSHHSREHIVHIHVIL